MTDSVHTRRGGTFIVVKVTLVAKITRSTVAMVAPNQILQNLFIKFCTHTQSYSENVYLTCSSIVTKLRVAVIYVFRAGGPSPTISALTRELSNPILICMWVVCII